MPANAGTISVKAVGKVVSAAVSCGVAPAELYRAAGLDPAMLDDPDRRIPYAQIVALYEEAARLTGDDAFGLHLGERTSPKVFDVLGYVLINSPTLGEGLSRVVRYHSIWNDGAGYTLDTDGARARLGYNYLTLDGRDCRHDCEMTLAITVHLSRAATRVEWTPVEVSFQHARPRDISEHQRIFRSPVHFSRPANEVVFDASLLSLPVADADAALCALLERHAEEMLSKFPRRGGLTDEVRRRLCDALGGGDLGLDTLAQQLGLSARTLQRKLKDEGTSHHDLLEEIRRDLSKRYLQEPRMAICEVAYLLGFSDASAFHRAFRRWTGLTPAEFRRTHG
jgi:AraC-like DNA-binding protein